MNLPPIGDARLNLLLRRQAEHDRNAELIATLSRDTGTPIVRPSVLYAPDPMDVRGIPAVGRNCPGRINGTRPDAICDRNH
jgi:hypothetical protein